MEKIENCINKNPKAYKKNPNILGERKQNQGNKTPKQEDNKKKQIRRPKEITRTIKVSVGKI